MSSSEASSLDAADARPEERDDIDLVRAIAAGDEPALAELYDRYVSRIFGFVLHIVGDYHEAEEVTLTCFLQIWRTASTFDESRGSVTSWMTSIARTRALDSARSSSRREKLLAMTQGVARDTSGALALDDLFESVSIDERARAVRSAMRSLPVTQREAIELAYFCGYSHSEIATQQAIPLGTVKSRIRQGMERMRTALVHFRQT